MAFSSTSYPATSGLSMQDLLLSLVLLGEQAPLVAADHARQHPAPRAQVDPRAMGEAGDRAGVAAADAERVDVEALEPHLHVPVLDDREHLLGHRDVLLHDEVGPLGVRGD